MEGEIKCGKGYNGGIRYREGEHHTWPRPTLQEG